MFLRTTEAKDIIVSQRQRKTFEKKALGELEESIQQNGLLHPIVLRSVDGKYHLVAGERRLRAVLSLAEENITITCDGVAIPLGQIPFTLITETDEIRVREIELTENSQRVDLSWQERVAALDELHSLRTAQNPKQSITDTAKEIAPEAGLTVPAARQRVHRATLIAEHLDNPEVAKAKDETTAYNFIVKNVEAELRAELAKRSLSTTRKHSLIWGDFREVNRTFTTIPPFTLILADPPYGMGADTFGDAAALAHHYKDDEETAIDIAGEIFHAGFSLTAEKAHLYMFCDLELFTTLRSLGTAAGWTVWRTPIIWHKTSASAHAPDHEYGFRRNYELLLFAAKGRKPFQQVYSDVIECAQEMNKTHAAQKPVALYERLIKRSCLPGEHVLDPCCGSGVIFPAAEACGVIATGVELNETFYKHSLVRLSEIKND